MNEGKTADLRFRSGLPRNWFLSAIASEKLLLHQILGWFILAVALRFPTSYFMDMLLVSRIFVDVCHNDVILSHREISICVFLELLQAICCPRGLVIYQMFLELFPQTMVHTQPYYPTAFFLLSCPIEVFSVLPVIALLFHNSSFLTFRRTFHQKFSRPSHL